MALNLTGAQANLLFRMTSLSARTDMQYPMMIRNDDGWFLAVRTALANNEAIPDGACDERVVKLLQCVVRTTPDWTDAQHAQSMLNALESARRSGEVPALS